MYPTYLKLIHQHSQASKMALNNLIFSTFLRSARKICWRRYCETQNNKLQTCWVYLRKRRWQLLMRFNYNEVVPFLPWRIPLGPLFRGASRSHSNARATQKLGVGLKKRIEIEPGLEPLMSIVYIKVRWPDISPDFELRVPCPGKSLSGC